MHFLRISLFLSFQLGLYVNVVWGFVITSKESRKSHHVDISVQLSVAAQWAEECCYSELLLIDQSEKALSQAECQYCCRHPVSETDRDRGGHCGRKLSLVIITHIYATFQKHFTFMGLGRFVPQKFLFYFTTLKKYLITGYFKICEYHLTMNSWVLRICTHEFMD